MAHKRLLTLLLQRMTEARRAIRYVFRNYPEVLQFARCEYERRKRAESRAAGRASR